ncbi:MAG: MiaB/RimO family radical SAM methylthiotransferase [Candidatus Omnitrophica bacterium]|nr:MiaB/RimO family radical SAM methylthiotransferase [Candidatus Omnitrophota bacterium]MCK5288475.1 MiaB/RimO family radical SAM methylthiotransferase [Candidatus Omnitrophota bacterium]
MISKIKKTFSVVSLGCFRNTYDTEILSQEFCMKGYEYYKGFSLADNKKSGNICDLLIINTCGFIDKAKEESIEIIKEAIEVKKLKRIKKILVFGCLVQRYREELEKFFPQVDEWMGIKEFSSKFSKRLILTPSYIGFLKICEGCLNKCSFCAIPLIKGKLRSKEKDAVIEEAKYLDKKGVKELNLIGQDITSWGKDFKSKEDLTFLVNQILKATKNIKWIRLIYTHPRNISQSLIDLIAKEDRICKYIDLPIQHINNRILKAMKRKITKKEIKDLICKIRTNIPGCVIRTSVIVGFPGETEEEFKELFDFLKEVKFDRLGTFIYSREEDTPAYNLKPQIHHSTKKRRYGEVMSLQQKIAQNINDRFVGQEIEVLMEDFENDVYIGRTQFDAHEVDGMVIVRRKGLKIGNFYKIKIEDAYNYDLSGV